MTLQLLHSEFPYILGKFNFLFYHCTVFSIKLVYTRDDICALSFLRLYPIPHNSKEPQGGKSPRVLQRVKKVLRRNKYMVENEWGFPELPAHPVHPQGFLVQQQGLSQVGLSCTIYMYINKGQWKEIFPFKKLNPVPCPPCFVNFHK